MLDGKSMAISIRSTKVSAASGFLTCCTCLHRYAISIGVKCNEVFGLDLPRNGEAGLKTALRLLFDDVRYHLCGVGCGCVLRVQYELSCASLALIAGKTLT